MPQIGANFQFTSRQPNFERDQFDTIANMAKCTICDEGHKCYCLENQKTYEFTSVDSNGDAIEPNETTGYWHEFSSGGNGDVTGATIGSGASEQNVTKVGSILKFPAYPTVPITGIKDANNNILTPNQGIVTLPTIPTVPISSIAKKTNDTNPITPNQGRVNLDLTAEDVAYSSNKTVKGKLNDIDKLIKDLTPDPNESSSTTIDLNLYSEWEDDESEYHSFIYDSSAIYVYETSSTSRITKTVSNVSHAVFKVSDRDIYIDYIISTSGNDTIYTANAIYNSSTLPSDFKKQFELGVYALICRIIGRSGDSIPYGKTIIADTENKVLNVVYRDVVDNNVTKHQLIARAFDKNRIYIYETPDATYIKGYRFKISYGTSDSGFNNLNKLFGGGGDASDIDFDDSVTQLSTQGYPINNVQTAIQLLATKIYGNSSILVITLTYNNGIRVANTVINISAIFQNNEYDFSSQLNDPNNAEYVTTVDNIKKFKTNSSGECRIGLPIGATYELTFNDKTNYVKPEPITGITDSTQTIIGASYQAMSDYETVILKVVVHGVSGYVTPSGKKVYIDTYNQNNTSVVDVEGLYEITLNANGTSSTVKIKEEASYMIVTDNIIKIDKGVLYKVRLGDWDDTGNYTKSTSPLFNAQKVNRGVTLAYTYTLSGTYLLLKDLGSEDGYKNYRIIEIDSTNNKIKIAREINGITSNYWIYKNSNDVYIYEESQDISTAYAWFEGINVDANNPIVGIGFRTQLLNNASSSARAISGTCAFCIIPYDVANVTAAQLREGGAISADNSDIDGLSNEESWLEIDSPTSPITKNIHNITASIGNNTYNAFLPAYRQLEIIIQNIDNINLIFSIFNKSLAIAITNANSSNLWSSTVIVTNYANGKGANGWNKNMILGDGSSNASLVSRLYRSIPVFPY